MKKKLMFDMVLNIISNAIPVFFLQLLILPALATRMADEKYGLLVTILALLNMIPASLGNVLNNIRLIYQKDSKNEASSDYATMLLIMLFLNLVIVGTFSFIYDTSITLFELILVLLVSIFWLIREYLIVAFRIEINYLFITISNLIMIIGYIGGYALFLITGFWQFIYIFGNATSIIFIICKSEIWKEKPQITRSFKTVSSQSILLFIANFFTRLTTYADKMLIYPLIGGSLVSVYYVATLFGKVVSMAITPVSGVLLSYLAKEKKKDNNTFLLAFFVSSIVSVLGYFICVAISRPVLTLIYPQYVDRAMQYIFVTTGTVVISALISMVNPFVLKFFDMRWQLFINGVYAAIYVGLSLALLKRFGLIGFCYGTLIASSIKLLFMISIYFKCKERENE